MADCNSWFDCNDEKKSNLGWFQILKLLITKDANGCPALRTKDTSSSGGGGGAVTLPSTQRVSSRTVVSISGSVAAGARYVSLELSSDFAGSILGDNDINNGGTVVPGAVYTFVVYQNDDTLGAIDYTRTAGKITISKNV